MTPEQLNKLLPCPFCGGKNIEDGSPGTYCKNCGGTATNMKSWNKRPKGLESGAGMKQDRNFSVRLKANVDKRFRKLGVFDRLLKTFKDYDKLKEFETAMFDSLEDITLDMLQGVKHNPLPDSPPVQPHRLLAETVKEVAVTIGYTREQMEGMFNAGSYPVPDKKEWFNECINSLPAPASLPTAEECLKKADALCYDNTTDVDLHFKEKKIIELITYCQTPKQST